MSTYCRPEKHRVQVRGGIEGDGSDGGDGDEDGKSHQFLPQSRALNFSVDPYSRSLGNSSSTRSRAQTGAGGASYNRLV